METCQPSYGMTTVKNFFLTSTLTFPADLKINLNNNIKNN